MSDAVIKGSTTSSGRRGLRWLVAGMVLAISATVAVSAWADRAHGGHHGGLGGAGLFMGPGKGMARGIDRMLDGVNATDAQRAQIKQIAQQAAADMQGQRDAHRALRAQAAQVFAAPNVDAAAAESVRQQLVAQHDANSRRMLQAMLDVSHVLTPEQRATLAEQMKQRQQRMQERMQQRMQRQQPKQ